MIPTEAQRALAVAMIDEGLRLTFEDIGRQLRELIMKEPSDD